MRDKFTVVTEVKLRLDLNPIIYCVMQLIKVFTVTLVVLYNILSYGVSPVIF